jgi:hypothetical protein
VWELLLEGCASLLGLTVRRSRGLLVVTCVVLGTVSVISVELWGASGLLVMLGLLTFAALVGLEVISARDALWRAACLSLEDPRQVPPDLAASVDLRSRTGLALRRLGLALDNVRRGRYDVAHDALPRIDRALLRADELRLFHAVRAMISIGLDDRATAAQLALAALPTGSEELDRQLGRAVIADAWHQPERLRAIHAAWGSAGIAPEHDGTLGRLHRLTRLRIDERLLDGVGAIEARTLSSEARAVGDEDLAADLESRARESAYR